MLSIIQFVARLVLYLNIVLDPCIHPLWASEPQNPVETLTLTFKIPLPKGYVCGGQGKYRCENTHRLPMPITNCYV